MRSNQWNMLHYHLWLCPLTKCLNFSITKWLVLSQNVLVALLTRIIRKWEKEAGFHDPEKINLVPAVKIDREQLATSWPNTWWEKVPKYDKKMHQNIILKKKHQILCMKVLKYDGKRQKQN